MHLPALQIKPFVFDSPPRKGISGAGLKLTAKRYTVRNSADNVDGLTLLFAHCIGSHKEQWEPTIQRIFHDQQSKDTHLRIREAWSFDWQNHGDAAVLNQDVLKSRPEGVSVYEWAPAIAVFVRSPYMKGHRIVPLGHSAGAGAMMLTTKEFPVSELPYVSLILVEPTMVSKELYEAHIDDRNATMDFTVGATTVRRDAWPSREEAFKWLSKRFPWQVWDPRVVRLLTEYGLQDAPSPPGGVILKCDRRQEAISYPDIEGHFEATTQMGYVCHALPIHIIWGSQEHFVPDYIQDSLSDVSQGRVAASVARVDGAAHMVVQEKPERLAQSICDALDSIRFYPSTRSRL